MKDQFEMEQLAEVEQMEKDAELDKSKQRIQQLEEQMMKMDEASKQGQQAVDIINDMCSKGKVEFDDKGNYNIVGNEHSQNVDSDADWVRTRQFEIKADLSFKFN